MPAVFHIFTNVTFTKTYGIKLLHILPQASSIPEHCKYTIKLTPRNTNKPNTLPIHCTNSSHTYNPQCQTTATTSITVLGIKDTIQVMRATMNGDFPVHTQALEVQLGTTSLEMNFEDTPGMLRIILIGNGVRDSLALIILTVGGTGQGILQEMEGPIGTLIGSGCEMWFWRVNLWRVEKGSIEMSDYVCC
jgi:hypothetical protein